MLERHDQLIREVFNEVNGDAAIILGFFFYLLLARFLVHLKCFQM
jgi:hypothetical protein